MTKEEKELFQKKMHDSVELRNKNVLQKCDELSKRVQGLMNRSDEVMKAAQELLQKSPKG